MEVTATAFVTFFVRSLLYTIKAYNTKFLCYILLNRWYTFNSSIRKEIERLRNKIIDLQSLEDQEREVDKLVEQLKGNY